MKNCFNKIITLMMILFACSFQGRAIEKNAHGVEFSFQGMNVKVQWYDNDIVRVTRMLEGTTYDKPDFVITKQPGAVDFELNENGRYQEIKTDRLSVKIDQKTGALSFFNLDGEKLFEEKPYGTTFSDLKDGHGTYLIRQNFLLDENEVLYGLGQHQNGRFNQRNQILDLNNVNTEVCIPLIQSTKGYGVYWDQYSSSEFEDNQQGMTMRSQGNCADYYFMYGGTMKGVLGQIRELTGDAPMFPLWSYGFFQSRERYNTQEEPVDVVKKYRELGVPLDCIIQDWRYWGEASQWSSMGFDPERYPNPQKMVDEVHAMNAKMMIVVWPALGKLTPIFNEMKEKNMLLDFETFPGNGTRPYDAFNPEAKNIYWKYMKEGLVKYGFDGWWMDATEPQTDNKNDYKTAMTHVGPFMNVRNAFAINTVGGVSTNQKKASKDKRVFILTRSASAGQQRFGANTWSGDVPTTFEALEQQIPAGINFSMCGIPYWNTDIGGFQGYRFTYNGGSKNEEFEEIYVRWMEFATFTPMMRSHGSGVNREIFQFGNRGTWAFDVQEKFIKLRYALLPYNYSTAWGVTHRRETFIRPLAMEFPEDKATYEIGNQYMYGDAFLVAPVTKEGQVRKEVYLPAGTIWYDYWNNDQYKGGETLQYSAPIDVLPLFVKAGSILPIGPDVQYAEEKKWDHLTFKIYPGANGKFILYEDENDSYNYEDGAYTEIEFSWDDEKQNIEISSVKGSFKGMLKKRKFTFENVDGTAKTVTYTGKKMNVKL